MKKESTQREKTKKMKAQVMKHFGKEMKLLQLVVLLAILALVNACKGEKEPASDNAVSITSPGEVNTITFFLKDDGVPCYLVKHGDKVIIDTSAMGFDFKGQDPMKSGFQVKNTTENTLNETWEMPWGEQRTVVNNYKELVVELEEKTAAKRPLTIYFRAYDDGVAFRYEFPEQEGVESLIIIDENSEFNMTGDHMSFWTPGDWDSYEYVINTCRLSEIDAKSKDKKDPYWVSVIPENAVHTPFTMKADDGTHISIHEANLTDYSGMTVKIGENNRLTSELTGSARLGYKAKCTLPFKTPWRTIQIGDKATDLIESNLIVNLNEPNKLGDVSWFKPMKYVGIWWEMHIGVSAWDQETSLAGGTKHGATTENTKKYIDFAAKNGFGGVLVEGWNTGWDNWIGPDADRENAFDFVTPYPDYDIKALAEYGKKKNVQLIMHNETSAAVSKYDQQMDTAYKLMESLGIHSVKTGYVGPVIPEGEYHHGQWMVNHYRKVLMKGAKHQVAINVHEPIKATGIRRTYPVAISREGARGQEYNAWAADGGNKPEHISLLTFTRLLGGPMDFTPGVFDITLPTKPNNQVNTTLAHQLALYVVIYSPVQMACDLPENYENKPAFQFIMDVGVDWEQSKALAGEIGEFVAIAREERETGNWFVGGITDENEREITVNFDFLDEGKKYRAIVYKDGEGAHYKDNPISITIEEMEVDKQSTATLKLAAGGGFAISLKVVE